MEEKNELVEIWGDVVDVKSLLLAMVISIVSTMGLYLLAPEGDRTRGLFLGLAGAVLGFLICSFVIKPKRDITIEDKE